MRVDNFKQAPPNHLHPGLFVQSMPVTMTQREGSFGKLRSKSVVLTHRFFVLGISTLTRLNPEDKRGGARFVVDAGIRDFRHFIDSNGFIDMGYGGAPFTWCNNIGGLARVWVRLDRAFCNASWRELYQGATVKHFSRALHYNFRP